MTGTARAADGVSDINWTSSSSAKVYDVYHSESYSAQSQVTLDSENTETYQTLVDVHLNDDPFRGYVTEIDWIEFSVLWEQVHAEEDQDDRFNIAIEVGLSQSYQYLSWGNPPWRGQDQWDMSWSYDRVYADASECPSCGIKIEARGVNLESGWFNDDQTIMSNPEWRVVMDEEAPKKQYQIDISDRQANGIDGTVDLSYDVSDSEGATANNPVKIYLNGNLVDQTTSTGTFSTTVDKSLLTGGTNTISIEVPSAGEATDPNNHPSYAYTVENAHLSASTDGNFDDDGWNNWNDSKPNDPNVDGEWNQDGIGAENKNDLDSDGTPNYADPDNDGDGLDDGEEVNQYGTDPTITDTDGDGLNDGGEITEGTNPTVADSDGDGINDGQEVNQYGTDPTAADTDGDGLNDNEEINSQTDSTKADTDGDGIPDGSDEAPTESEDIDGCQDGDGAPEPDRTCQSDTDGDGIIDSNDGAPNRAEDQDGYEDSDGVLDPDNDGDGVPDDQDVEPNNPEDLDGCQDSDGTPEPDGTCSSEDGNNEPTDNDSPPPVGGFDNPPTDPDTDGQYEDVNGDGSTNVADAQALFANSDSSAVQNHISAFDFNGDGAVNVADAQALFADL